MKSIEEQRWRPNVAMVIINHENKVLWAKRADKDVWQFPQGGINPGEPTIDAMYRELQEELGLQASDVEVLAEANDWRKYNFLAPMLGDDGKYYVGQQQKWFLLRLLADDSAVELDKSVKPEFMTWEWVDYWRPQQEIVTFKKPVYEAMMQEFAAVIEIEK